MLKFISKSRLLILILFSILLFGLWLRYENIKGANIVFDYDQIEDQFYTYKIAVDRDFPIIGRAIYGDPRLHHGVFYYYYNTLPFLISGGNFFASTYWNSFFNTAVMLILFFLSRAMFKKILPGLLTAIIAAVSFEFIKFSNWLTIDTVTIFTVPLFYLGLWLFYLKKGWGLILSALGLGLSIQADLTFLYLIPIFVVYLLIFRPNLNLKFSIRSLITLLVTISTLILTEIKLNFIGVKTLLNFSNTFSDTKLPIAERLNLFLQDFGINFSRNLIPDRPDLGIYLVTAIILITLYFLFKHQTTKQEKYAVYFLLLYLLSPAITLLLGYHQKPWFLIGLPPAIALITGYAISKLKLKVLILGVILTIVLSNTTMVLNRPSKAYRLFDSIYDSTSYLDYQLQVIDYTYKSSAGKPFAINAVTYPLYYNGMWAYLYNWYGREKFKFVPVWLGGDQLHPYDLLPKADQDFEFFYVLISETGRIPEVFKNQGKKWGEDKGKFIEEQSFPGFTVRKYEKSQAI